MRISFDFKVGKKEKHEAIFDDYVNRISHFATLGKAKKEDIRLVFVAGRCSDAECLTSEELAKRIERRLVQGASGLVVSVEFVAAGKSDKQKCSGGNDCDDFRVKAAGKLSQNDATYPKEVKVLLVEENIPLGLAQVLAAEQVYRLLMINAGRSYHK